jgi:hypothetical protein
MDSLKESDDYQILHEFTRWFERYETSWEGGIMKPWNQLYEEMTLKTGSDSADDQIFSKVIQSELSVL